MRRRVVFYTLLAFSITRAASAQTAVDAAIRAARQQIDAGHPSDALAALQAFDTSQATSRAKARIHFYEARAFEEMEDEEKAIAAYQQAIGTEPSYGAALNNLAQILSRRGDNVRAAELMKKAVTLDDPHLPLYLDNYGALAEKSGDIDAARAAYARLAALQPENAGAQVNAIRLIDDPHRMALQLAKLANRGETGAAESLAFDLLPKQRDEAAKRELLGTIAGALAVQHIDPKQFDSKPAAARLSALGGDPAIKDGVAAIFKLYAGKANEESCRWWRSATPDPRFAALLRDVAASYASSPEPKAGERMYRLALWYSNGADPDAFIDLADLYFTQKRTSELNDLAHRYEAAMFAETIAKGDYGSEYRFHIALGTMYAYLQQWGSDTERSSAIFQLSQAQRAAADYNRTVSWGPRILTDPKSVELLATGYEAVKNIPRACSVRIEGAADLLRQGRKTAAIQILTPISNGALAITEPSDAARYAELKENLKKPIVLEYTVAFPDAVEMVLVPLTPGATVPSEQLHRIGDLLHVYATAESDRERDYAEQTMAKLGVSYLDPTTMSRTEGEFAMEIAGKQVRYRYTVRSMKPI